uniref:Cilia- and flagella-associated protein 43 n=1 Tax=Hanusia phi TaxID=3032 RepID=A0A6T7TPL9_9CRYP|mmetsp:Transcript_8924/g.20387  ORF Transcript_8924/g.20387 Transcript_8924/m.20387 type:complete len:1562 (+) Transcript_8924:319-5004(+)
MSELPLNINACLGYSGSPLVYGGGGKFLAMNGNIVSSFHADLTRSEPSRHFPCKGFGPDMLIAHPSFNFYAYAERGEKAAVHVCSMEDGKEAVHMPNVGAIGLDCMSFSQDGESMATISSIPDQTVSIWNWGEDGVDLQVSGTSPQEFSSCHFNPKNSDQLVLHGNGQLFLCNIVNSEQGTPELEFLHFDPPSPDVEFSSFTWDASGRLFSTTSDGGLWQLDASLYSLTGEPCYFTDDPAVSSSLLSFDHFLVVCTGDTRVLWFDADTLSKLYEVKLPVANSLVSACLCSDSPRGDVILSSSDGSVFLLEMLADLPHSFNKSEAEVKDMDVVFGEVQRDHQHSLKRILISHVGRVIGLSFSPVNSHSLISAGEDGKVIFWDCRRKCASAVQHVGRPMSCIEHHPTLPLLAVGDEEGSVQILDLSSLPKLRSRSVLKLFHSRVVSIRFSERGGILAAMAEGSSHVYLVKVEESSAEVRGYVEIGASCSGRGSLLWVREEQLIVAAELNHLLRIENFSAGSEEELELAADLSRLRTEIACGQVVRVGGKLAASSSRSKKVLVYELEGSWTPTRAEETSSLPPAVPLLSFGAHDKVVLHMAGGQDGVLASGGGGGKIVLRSGEGLGSVYGLRAFSAWQGGCSALCLSSSSLLACASCNGTVLLLSSDLVLVQEEGTGPPARFTVSRKLLDLLGEEAEGGGERTYEEVRLSAMQEMNMALNAVKKNEMRDRIRQIKAQLDFLLEKNSGAPELEKIPREEIVIDMELRQRIIAGGDARVEDTKRSIVEENVRREEERRRIKEMAWDSMETHGMRIHAFSTDLSVPNYPILKLDEERRRRVDRIRTMREIELRTLARQQQEFGVSKSFAQFDSYNLGSIDLKREGGGDKAAEVEALKTPAGPDSSEETWRGQQEDPLMYHRLNVTTRERKTAQIYMTEGLITSVKTKFNALFDEFLKKKSASLGKMEEKQSRILEILKELKQPDAKERLVLHDDELPNKLLEVSDAEISAPKWISQAEQKARDEEARKQRDASAGDANVERALNMMMGGTLAGANALSKLEQVMTKPANLEVGENEELTEEQQQKLKEWEAQYKAFLAEQDAYAKSLEGEAKKLKSEMAEESKKFDDQLLELTELRMRTEYKLIELELYKVKLVQAIAQEEDDILARQSLVLGLEELKYRHDLAEKAVRDYLEEVKTYELSVDAVRQEGANLEKALRKELQEQAADKETIDQAVKAFKKRGRLEEILQGFGADVIQRLEQLVAEARDQDEVVQEHVAQLDNMRNELKRLEWAKTQIEESIETAEEELKKLLERMARAEYDLDLTVGMKQGQVEVEQSIFITDYSDAELVERSEISTFNGAIKTRGSDKIAVLNEIKEFRKGIHLLQWENQRLELQEEDCLQKTKDLQLLRVTKSLQRFIKGSSGESQSAKETSGLERMIAYQSEIHQQRIEERTKAVEALEAQRRTTEQENSELDEDIFALESSVVERQRLCELQGSTAVSGGAAKAKKSALKMSLMVTHRRLLDLAKAQTREIELMREELVRLRARTFPSFAQLADNGRTMTGTFG